MAGRAVLADGMRAVTCVALMLLVMGLSAAPQKKGKPAPERAPDTLILVSTFSEVGQVLRGTRVRLYPADGEGKVVKGKVLDGQTNNMGEFPFHVPKVDAHFVLVAESKGFARTEKHITVRQEDQLDVFLQLPVRKPEK